MSPSPRRRLPSLLTLLIKMPLGVALALLLVTIGCGGNSTVSPTPTPTPTPVPPSGFAGVVFTGKVLGGATPVAGSSVMLYSAGATGNGSAPTALLSAALTTDTTGAFSVPAGYTCPSSSSEIYLLARGGSLIAGQSSNATVALLLALGPCGSLSSGAAVTINELTTVAAVWPLQQFLAAGGAIGAPATNALGLGNAVNTSLALAAAATQTTSAPTAFPATATPPTAKISTLAGLLHLCVADAASTGCSSLLSLTTVAGAAAPPDVLEAARNLALHPASHVAALFFLNPPAPGFGPTLPAAPADWTLAITYTGGGLHAPTALGISSQGTVWVANYYGVLSAFDPTGHPLFPAGITGSGLQHSYGLALDASDAVWVSNEDSDGSVNQARGSVSKFSATGQPLSGLTGFGAGGLNYPIGLAADANGTLWVVNYGNTTVTLLDSSGNPLSGTAGFTLPGSAFPVAIALDAAHNGWIGDQNDGTVAEVSPDGKQVTPFSCCSGPASLAIDQAGHTWVANYDGASVTEITPASAAATASTTTFAVASLNKPQGLAIDGLGRVWVASYRGPGLTELTGAADPQPGATRSPAAGYLADSPVTGAFALAIDAAGNLWITDFDTGVLTEVVGLAAPVKTPLLGPAQAP